jgi:ParB/RepB/Spo0J family partition protein
MSSEQTDYSARNIETKDIKLTAIRQSLLNPRKHFDEAALAELAESIKCHGLLEPIVVRWIDGDGWYEIIAGERRWRAAQQAGLQHIPCRILENINDACALELALVENLCRRDIDPIEEAQGYRQLMDMGHKQTAIAERVNRSQEAISNTVRLLKLPETVQEHISAGRLSVSHGRALASYAEYPRVLDFYLKKALEGAPTKAIEKIDGSDPYYLESAKAAIQIYNDGFISKHCAKCPHLRSAVNYKLCLDPVCKDRLDKADYDARQAELKAAAAAAIARAGVAKGATADGGADDTATADTAAVSDTPAAQLLRTNDLRHDEFKNLVSQHNQVPVCRQDCESRVMALNHDEVPIEICIDPKCHEALRIKAEKEKKAAIRAEHDALLACCAKQLAPYSAYDVTRRAALVCLQCIDFAKKSMIKDAAQRWGLSIDIDAITRSSTNTDKAKRLDELCKVVDGDTIIRFGIDVLMAKELDEVRSGYGKPVLVEWYLQSRAGQGEAEPRSVEAPAKQHETREEAIARLQKEIQDLQNAAKSNGTSEAAIAGQISKLQGKIDRLQKGTAMPMQVIQETGAEQVIVKSHPLNVLHPAEADPEPVQEDAQHSVEAPAEAVIKEADTVIEEAESVTEQPASTEESADTGEAEPESASTGDCSELADLSAEIPAEQPAPADSPSPSFAQRMQSATHIRQARALRLEISESIAELEMEAGQQPILATFYMDSKQDGRIRGTLQSIHDIHPLVGERLYELIKDATQAEKIYAERFGGKAV